MAWIATNNLDADILDKDMSPWEGDLYNIPISYHSWPYARFVAERRMIKLTNLYGLFQLGSDLQEISGLLNEQNTLADVAVKCFQIRRSLALIKTDTVIPLIAIHESADNLIISINNMIPAKAIQDNWQKPLNPYYTSEIKGAIVAFKFALSEELRQLPTYIATKKGMLSIDMLVNGASKGYSDRVIDLIDDFIIFEIDEAGRCLAFGLFTACGFHILRSVEVAIKGYLHALRGSLPKQNQRNWGEYIKQLENAGASPELVDCLKILKTKRNPLMHPQDKLEEEEAISLFNLCNSTMEGLSKDIVVKNLDVKFKSSLATLPTL